MGRGNKNKNKQTANRQQQQSKAVKKEENREKKWETTVEVVQTIENIYGVEPSCKTGISAQFLRFSSDSSVWHQKKNCVSNPNCLLYFDEGVKMELLPEDVSLLRHGLPCGLQVFSIGRC